jgi:glycosyltransferase involved in cell wall biosynthesis
VSPDLPLVTIVTPSLNQGRYLEQTIRSVRGQTYPRVEHIVVDGGSTDDTLEILRRNEDSYDLSWTSEADRGMYDALNKGFGRATGELFAYLNSDDLYFPWTVETAVREYMRGAELVYGDALLVDDDTGHLRPHFQLPVRRSFFMTIGSLAQPATFWRRSLHERLSGFDATLRSAADLDFYIRATRVARCAKVDEFLALMRLHADMQTVAHADRIARENAIVRSRYTSPAARRPRILAERARAWLGRRRQWARFVIASRTRSSPTRPWGAFLASGVRLAYVRILLGQLPTLGPRALPGAVTSAQDWRVAADRR